MIIDPYLFDGVNGFAVGNKDEYLHGYKKRKMARFESNRARGELFRSGANNNSGFFFSTLAKWVSNATKALHLLSMTSASITI